MKAGIYVHIPFCQSKCRYCSFNSVPYDAVLAARYMDALGAEMSARGLDVTPASVYIGGGTPTVLPGGCLEGLIGRINDIFRPAGPCEFTVEANPGTLEGADLGTLRALGVNRISLGAQSFDGAELAMLGRTHGPGKVYSSVERLRAAGFDNISIDLIYALPGQGMKRWKQNLREAVGLSPDHLSLYGLSVEPGTAFYAMMLDGRLHLPDEALQAGMYLEAVETLGMAGYAKYELSNFARPGRECVHNDNYWSGGDYLGFGAGAHSHRAGTRYENSCDIMEYVRAVTEGRSAVTGSETLSPAEAEGEFIMLGLRKAAGLSLGDFERRFKRRLLDTRGESVRRLSEAGYVELSRGRLRLTLAGSLASNPVMAELI